MLGLDIKSSNIWLWLGPGLQTDYPKLILEPSNNNRLKEPFLPVRMIELSMKFFNHQDANTY